MLSVIVPTLNESAHLPQTIAHVRQAARGAAVELIVSDCDSADDTRARACSGGAIVQSGGTCRADAMNRGAIRASGDVLLFLHADSIPPIDFVRLIERALRDPSVVGGAFEFRLGPHPLNRGLNRKLLGLVTFCNRVRYRYSRGFFGDQGIFVRRDVFHRLGGFPPVRLMEDLTFCRRMGRVGRTAILPAMETSPRRFVQRGVLRQFVQDLVLLSCDSWGIRPQRLWDHYNRHNRGDAQKARLLPPRRGIMSAIPAVQPPRPASALETT